MNEKFNNLDESLERTESMRTLLGGLPEEPVSLQWRSELNEKILAMAEKPRRSWMSLLWKPTMGLAAASAIAIVVIVSRPQETVVVSRGMSPASELSAAMLSEHESSYAYREMGVAIPQSQSQSLLNLIDTTEEVDLGAL